MLPADSLKIALISFLISVAARQRHDDLAFPKRLMESKYDGSAARVIPERINNAIEEYYKERGWDGEGVPTKQNWLSWSWTAWTKPRSAESV